ncbi:MAG: hypothetical protein M0006_13675 [Magnetospirillum sp.]|nr:hypothetical protein [Magnetospirillum sp.]
MCGRQLFIDLDGVLLRSRSTRAPFNTDWELAPYALDFMDWAVANHDCHWLTTRDANGSHEGILLAFRLAMAAPQLPAIVVSLIRAIRPTRWNANKSSVLPFGGDFLWLDDNPSTVDLLELERRGSQDRWLEVNTDVRPDDLLRVKAVIEGASKPDVRF